jgi:hypothetical protein
MKREVNLMASFLRGWMSSSHLYDTSDIEAEIFYTVANIFCGLVSGQMSDYGLDSSF